MRAIHTFILAITMIIAGCGGGEDSANKVTAAPSAQYEEIVDVARRQASRFVEIADDDMQAQNLLLDVRSKETQLRMAGRDAIADDYVEAFTAEVKRLNPTLADTTFVEKK